jgi:hypothetical protein
MTEKPECTSVHEDFEGNLTKDHGLVVVVQRSLKFCARTPGEQPLNRSFWRDVAVE